MKRFVAPLFLGCCAFLGGMAAVALASSGLLPAFAQALPAAAPGTDLGRLSDRFEIVARSAAPAVVSIEAIKPIVKGGKARTTDDSGSGSLIRLSGQRGTFVLTNNHVVNKAAPNQITVSTANGRVLKPTRVWADPESDVALLALGEVAGLSALTLGDSDRAAVGQWVLAVGSPFGLSQTVTHGIISARGRGQVSLGSTIRIKDFLQTDAAINPGSSGGPLLDLAGEQIGMNTAIASPSGSNSGVAFAIPINLVKQVAAQLLAHGRVKRGYLGVQLASTFEPADALRLGLTHVLGALVEGAHTDTPAATAGFRRGDAVLEIDGVAVRNENHFINTVSGLAPGQRIRVKVWRDKNYTTLEAVIGDWTTAEGRFRR